jgi:predicted Zn-dependent protease
MAPVSLRIRLAALCLLVLATSPAWARGPYMVCLQPLGKHDASLLAPIARGLEQAYGVPVRRLPALPLPASAWYPPRSRYRASKLLDHLRSAVLPAQPACDAVVGFTAVDVSMTKGEHADWGVLGLSYLRGRVGVVSSFRMHRHADRALLVRRATKVVIHEFGHVLGLAHRREGADCIMNDAGGAVAVIDRALGPLCPGERAEAESLLGRKLPPRAALDWNAIEKATKK